MKINIFILATLVILIGCTYKGQEQEENHEAILLHNSMIEKAGLIARHLNELKDDSTVHMDSLVNLETLLKQWTNDLVEVPGNEKHDHHGHVHNHSNPPNITEEQMLEIQKALNTQLTAIEDRLLDLKPDLTLYDYER